jgi:hypothetical protein
VRIRAIRGEPGGAARRLKNGRRAILATLSAVSFCAEHSQLPRPTSLIVANKICIAVFPLQLEVPIVGCEPCIENLGDGDAAVCKNQHTGRLLASVSRIALDVDFKEPFTHAFCRSPVENFGGIRPASWAESG